MSPVVREVGPVIVVELIGSINIHALRWLNTQFTEWINAGRLFFVFDMNQVTVITSSGIGALIGYSQELKKLGGAMALSSMHQSGKEVKALTKLDSLFKICDTADEAVGFLQEKAAHG